MNKLSVLLAGVVAVQSTCVTNTLVIPPEGITSPNLGGAICGGFANKAPKGTKTASFSIEFPASDKEFAVGLLNMPSGVENVCTVLAPAYIGGLQKTVPGQRTVLTGGGSTTSGFHGVLAINNDGAGPNDPCIPCLTGVCKDCRGCGDIKLGPCKPCWTPDPTSGESCFPGCSACYVSWTIPGPGLLNYTNCDGPLPPTPAPVPTPAAPTPKPPAPTPKPTPIPADSCATHPLCKAAGLSGECCPTAKGTYLSCCGQGAACSANPGCAALGIEGDCCPTITGTKLDCCNSEEPATLQVQ